MNFYYKHIYTQSFICTPVNISKCSIQAKIDMIKFLTDLDNKRFGILFNLSCYWSGSSFPYDFLYLIDQSFLHLFEWLQTNRQICCLTDTFIILKQSSYIHWFFFFFTPFLLCQQRGFSLSAICPSSRPLNIVQNQKTDLSPEENEKKISIVSRFLVLRKKVNILEA